MKQWLLRDKVLPPGQSRAKALDAKQVYGQRTGKGLWLWWEGRHYFLQALGLNGRGEEIEEVRALRAPMTGRIKSLAVQLGQAVKAGDLLFVLEAMKMEHEIKAPGPTKVARILCNLGEAVEVDQLIMELEKDGDTHSHT